MNSNRVSWTRLSAFLFALMAASLMLAGCEENPVVDDENPDCEHVDADGLRVKDDGGNLLVEQWDGSNTGDIDVEHDATMILEIVYLDPDQEELDIPAECGHSLGWSIDDDSIVSIALVDGESWMVELTGLTEGMTSVRFTVVHGDHDDFTSQPIEVHVTGEGELEVDGMILRQGATDIVTVDEGSVTGEIEVEHLANTETIEVWFIDHGGNEFQPDVGEGFDLAWTIGDELIATYEELSDWSFRLFGVEDGMTTVTFDIEHEGHSDYSSPAIEIHVGDGELEVDGMILRQGATDIVTVDEGSVTGQIDVTHLSNTASIDVWFVDHDGNEFQPDVGEGFDLAWTIANESVATYEELGDWSFRLFGDAIGMTTISFDIEHEGHSDYTSPAIDIDVVAPAAPDPQALILLDGEQWVGTWNYDATKPAQATGPLFAFTGTTKTNLEARFLDSDRNPIVLPAGYRAQWILNDGSIATITRAGGAAALFDFAGDTEGSTTVRVELIDDTENSVWTSGNIPVLVFSPTGSDATPTFQLRKNGRTDVGVIDNSLVAASNEVCSSMVWDAALKTVVGEQTTLYSVRYFNDLCERIEFDSGNSLLFEFADRGIARSTNHPEHWGEITVFHVDGLSAGSTTMRLIVLDNFTDVVFVSPPLPVEIDPS